jgi:DNA-binding response OmpR family regulator
MRRILVIKSIQSPSETIQNALQQEPRFNVTFHHIEDGIAVVYEEQWDFILLDSDTFLISGAEVCREIRKFISTPIIVITDQQSGETCVQYLRSGADDYVRKPFDTGELIARIKVVLRRNKMHPTLEIHKYIYRDLIIDEQSKLVYQNHELVHLTSREFDLLLMLIKNKNKIVNREALLNQVWGFDVAVNPNVVDLYIGYLRKKLAARHKKKYIKTVHGRGYTLIEEVAQLKKS